MRRMWQRREEQLDQALEESSLHGPTPGATAWRITGRPNRCQLGVPDKRLEDTTPLSNCQFPSAVRYQSEG